MYPFSTTLLAACRNQQNILDGITPLLPSMFVNDFNASNKLCGNFNYNNSNIISIGVVRGDSRDIKKKLIIDSPKTYSNQPTILKASKYFFHDVIFPCFYKTAFKRHNNVPNFNFQCTMYTLSNDAICPSL